MSNKHPHYLNFHWLHLSGEKYAVVKISIINMELLMKRAI